VSKTAFRRDCDESRKACPSSGAEEARRRMISISSHISPRERAEQVSSGKVIRYSSLRPWILAIALSIMLWAMFGWWLFH
jgi:hypothetical protein